MGTNIDWDNWSIGGKIIFVTGFFAFSSMFMVWMKSSNWALTGFVNHHYWILLFWAYPLTALVLNRRLNIYVAMGSAFAALVFTGVIMNASTNASVMFSELLWTKPGLGAWVALVASLGLFVGVAFYEPASEERVRYFSARDRRARLVLLKEWSLRLGLMGLVAFIIGLISANGIA